MEWQTMRRASNDPRSRQTSPWASTILGYPVSQTTAYKPPVARLEVPVEEAAVVDDSIAEVSIVLVLGDGGLQGFVGNIIAPVDGQLARFSLLESSPKSDRMKR